MKKFPRYNPIGVEEKKAVSSVIDSGCLSQFIGAWGDDFHGGSEVNKFEEELSDYFCVKYAVTFNSLTSGLIAAVGAIGIEPGDEVIVSPWTMSATATAIIIWGGIPIFCDIETEFYGIDTLKAKALINERTKAIMVTDIFGHGSKLDEIKALCKNHKLKLIEDVAQAPGIKYKNKWCGTWGDIGGFSLNYHKHIHTGEGGFCITNDKELALRMKMIRNHAEASVVDSPIQELTNMVGYNFRMGEIEAAIGRAQLKKLDSLLMQNQENASTINSILSKVSDFQVAKIEINSEHAFYVLPIRLKKHEDKRSQWIGALERKGIPGLFEGYVNVHQLPMYQQKIAFGKGYPWSISNQYYSYDKGICPIAEHLKDASFVGFLISMYELSEEDCHWIANTMVRTWEDVAYV